MLLVSWNVAGRKSRLQEQADRVLQLSPDVVCLQEVTPVTAGAWSERLAAAGLTAALAPLPRSREGFRDAFRALNGFESKEPSWEWPRWGGGYRLDHLIASAEVTVSACSYRHDWRRDGLLWDHSALVAELSVRV